MFQRYLRLKFHQSYLNLWCRQIRKSSTEIGEKNENEYNLYSKYVNDVKLVGYVANIPKKYESELNVFLTFFKVATARYYYDKSETRQKYTTWHSIIVRKPFLQDYVLKYVSKGTRVYISGYLDSSIYDFDDNAHFKSAMHVVAEEVIYFRKFQFPEQENSPYL